METSLLLSSVFSVLCLIHSPYFWRISFEGSLDHSLYLWPLLNQGQLLDLSLIQWFHVWSVLFYFFVSLFGCLLFAFLKLYCKHFLRLVLRFFSLNWSWLSGKTLGLNKPRVWLWVTSVIQLDLDKLPFTSTSLPNYKINIFVIPWIETIMEFSIWCWTCSSSAHSQKQHPDCAGWQLVF